MKVIWIQAQVGAASLNMLVSGQATKRKDFASDSNPQGSNCNYGIGAYHIKNFNPHNT